MLKVEDYDFKSFVVSVFLTTVGLAFFVGTVASVIVRSRRNHAARSAAIDLAAQPVALKPLKECRYIVVVHPSGEMEAGDPGTPESENNP